MEGDRVAIDLDKEISRLRSAAGLSVSVTVNENYGGEVSARELTLRVNDGSTEKTHTFTLQKFNIVDTERNLSPIGRWVHHRYQLIFVAARMRVAAGYTPGLLHGS